MSATGKGRPWSDREESRHDLSRLRQYQRRGGGGETSLSCSRRNDGKTKELALSM